MLIHFETSVAENMQKKPQESKDSGGRIKSYQAVNTPT